MLLRTTLAARTRVEGPDDQGTLATESQLTSAARSGEVRRGGALSRGTLEKKRRVLGSDHSETLISSAHLAASLSGQDKRAARSRGDRARGPRLHDSATRRRLCRHVDHGKNLAHSLSQCGQKAESEQILRETLALCRRTLGPAHEVTQLVLREILRSVSQRGERPVWAATRTFSMDNEPCWRCPPRARARPACRCTSHYSLYMPGVYGLYQYVSS